MKIFDLLSMCISSLFRRKLRTSLTVIGVVIGTCSIVIMISLGIGLNESTMKSYENMGDLTVINVYNWPAYSEDGTEGVQPPALDANTINQILSFEGVKAATPISYFGYGMIELKSGKYLYEGQIIGVNISALSDFGYELIAGKFPQAGDHHINLLFGEKAGFFFYDPKKPDDRVYPEYDEQTWEIINEPSFDVTKSYYNITVQKQEQNEDYMYANKVTVSTQEGGSEEGETEDSTSSYTAKKQKAYPVGVLKGDRNKNGSSDSIFIDISVLDELEEQYNKLNKIEKDEQSREGYDDVQVKCTSVNEVSQVVEAIKELGYDVWSPESMVQEAQKNMLTIQLVLGALGGISLLVAAIGITNTMIMAIYERTREIGVMKVLGCRLSNIRMMFLLEAGGIGIIGGAIGIAVSYGLSFAANSLLSGAFGNFGTGEPTPISIIPIWLVLFGLVFSLLVGVISGFYPANRAVKISSLSAIKQD